MKRIFIFTIILTSAIKSFAFDSSTTYIPSYYSLIQISYNDNDSTWVESQQLYNNIISRDNTFSVTVINEEVDKDKVLSIKRKKCAAGFAQASAILAGASAILTPVYNKHNFYLHALQVQTAYHSAYLASYLENKADNEETLKIQYRIDNLSDKELLVSDMERGLSWYIRPKHYLLMNVTNPDCGNLRIQTVDASYPTPKYISITGASYVKKYKVAFQNNDTWIVEHQQNVQDDRGNVFKEVVAYTKIDKVTFERKMLSVEDGETLIKQLKKNKNE